MNEHSYTLPPDLGARFAEMTFAIASESGQSIHDVLEGIAKMPEETLRGCLADIKLVSAPLEPVAAPDPNDRTKKVLEAALGYASYGLSVRLITKQLSFEEFLTGQTGLRKLAAKLEEVLS